MKLKIRGHYVTIFNSRDEEAPVGVNIDGVFVGKVSTLDVGLSTTEQAIEKIERAQAD